MRLSVLFLCLSCSLAEAADTVPSVTVGDWEVLVDETTGPSCFAQKDFDDGTRVQIGFDILREGGFFAVYNADWTEIKEGDIGTVRFAFSDLRFAGDAKGRISDGLPGGYAFFDNPSFVDEFARRNWVKVASEEGIWFEISLAGSSAAIQAIRVCQKEQSEALAD